VFQAVNLLNSKIISQSGRFSVDSMVSIVRLNSFRQQDKDVNIPFQGLFLYTSVMPCMILANACSPFGLVNAAVDVVLDPNGKSTRVDINIMNFY
jgi:hypothetical protein